MTIFKIFESTSNAVLISRFCKFGHEQLAINNGISGNFLKGVQYLDSSVVSASNISKNDVALALQEFVICETKNNIYGKIFSKIGKVVCFYLLDNKPAMKCEVESIAHTAIPKKVNVKGVLAHTGRAAAVVGGLLLFPVYHIGGAALAVYGSRIPVEDPIVTNQKVGDLIWTFESIDFTPFYKNLSN